jgi:uncharacterized membrane-anchored protein
MNKYKNLIFAVFIIMVLVQLYIPANIVFRGERLIASGKEYKFKTEPVDPNDPFRGKYIALRFEANRYQIYDTVQWERNRDVYVTIENDADGYAKISDVTISQPDEGIDYIKANIDYSVKDNLRTTLFIKYPFNRYYMEETKSAEAEKIYRESLLDSTKITFALVNIKQGSAVLTDVMVNGVSLKDLIKKK